VPDLIVKKVEGQFEVYLNDGSVPMLHINRSYMQLIKRGGTAKKEVKNYIREKLNGAAWLVRSRAAAHHHAQGDVGYRGAPDGFL